MSEETKLDLDALSAEEATNWEFGDLVREVNRLRQRLREAEAENERLLVDDGGAFTTAIRVKERRKLLNRIAQLERVREAVIAYLAAYIDREALDAALAAVEEKP